MTVKATAIIVRHTLLNFYRVVDAPKPAVKHSNFVIYFFKIQAPLFILL